MKGVCRKDLNEPPTPVGGILNFLCKALSAMYLSYAALAIIPIALMKPMKIHFDSTLTSPRT